MKRRPSTHDTSNLTDLRVGLYVRVSQDKEDTGKSTTDQEAVGREWVGKVGANLVDVYRDNDISASRHTRKIRPDFNRLVADIKDGKLDVLWFWEQSRATRKLDVFADLLNLCRTVGVLWVERDRVIDPNDSRDMLTAGFKALIDVAGSEDTSERTARGKKSSARAGRRAGTIPYGYRAVFARDGQYLHDEPDLFDGDGRPEDDSPAAVVREIYARLLGGHSITSIRNDLNDRGSRTRGGYPWRTSSVRYVATSPTYAGMRVYQGGDYGTRTDRVKTVLDGVATSWPALVDAETWWAVHRLLADPARHTGGVRPGGRNARTLLSALARCAECGGKLSNRQETAVRNGRRLPTASVYWCKDRGHLGIKAALLDEYVETTMVRWLSDPKVVAHLTRVDNSAAAAEARGDVEQLRADLTGLVQDAKAGRVSPTIATVSEQGLLARIEEAEDRVQAATLPPVLRGRIGPQAEAGWVALDVETKRAMIRAVADIRVRTVGRNRGRLPAVPAAERVDWRWLIGPDAE